MEGNFVDEYRAMTPEEKAEWDWRAAAGHPIGRLLSQLTKAQREVVAFYQLRRPDPMEVALVPDDDNRILLYYCRGVETEDGRLIYFPSRLEAEGAARDKGLDSSHIESRTFHREVT